MDSVKLPPFVVDKWASGSLTRRLKGSFAVSWPMQLDEQNVITITILLPGNEREEQIENCIPKEFTSYASSRRC